MQSVTVLRRPSSVASSGSSIMTDQTAQHAGPFLEGNMKLLDTLDLPHEVMCCRFTNDGSHLAVGLADGTIKIYAGGFASPQYSLSDDETKQFRLPTTMIQFRPHVPDEPPEHSHILLASYASGLVKFWHYTSSTCVHTINEGRQVLVLERNFEGSRFFTAGDVTSINLYDMETRKKLRTLEPSDSRDLMDGHRLRVHAGKYHPKHPNLFITGGWDDTVQYWDDRKVHAVNKFSGPHICGDALDIDPIHDHILTGSWRKTNTLQIWDFPTAQKIKDVPQDQMNSSQLYCAQWLGKDSIVCGGSEQNMARVIDRGTLNTTGQLVELHQGVYCIDNDRSGNHPAIAIGSGHHMYIVRNEKK